ncbi:putative protein FANTASTIC FOUR 3 [Cocos nucifera]|uniref:FAF domain-containing protein n=1 Tax=Cocos nucifera TaxID=13894 RepID=A0A8K0HTF5_COCNU|nr:putative protein FANTASTIC FOUR 3 [Cocos nucifera]
MGPGRPPEKPDPGARGLHECCYDDGLGLCTESLGSESCCDGSLITAEEAAVELEESSSGADEAEAGRRSRRGRSRGRREERVFPPPLSWVVGNGGRRSIYLVPERNDGRLVIKLKTFDRPEIFAATRQNGRLLLHLIEPETEEEEEEGEKEAEADAAPSAEEEDGERGGRWEWRMGEIEGVRRCQESVSGNEVLPPWWNHRFLTTA